MQFCDLRSSVLRLFWVFLLGLSLVSCTSGTATSPVESMTLRVGQVTNAISFFPMYVAEAEGFFKAQGLTLNPSPPLLLNSGSKVATAVESGSIDIGIGGTTDAFTISRVDAFIKMIGTVSNNLLIDVVVSKRFEAQTGLSATSPLADKVKALVGKKVGISAPGSASEALITYLFKQQGLDDQKQVVKVNLGADTATQLAALQSGRIDAATVGPPGGEEAMTQGFGEPFISPARGDDPSLVGQLFNIAYARQQTIDAKPRAVQAFIRGLAQAETFIQKHPTQMPALLEKYLTNFDQKTLNSAWDAVKTSMPPGPQICQHGYDVADTFHLKAKIIALPLSYKDLVATDTIHQALGASADC